MFCRGRSLLYPADSHIGLFIPSSDRIPPSELPVIREFSPAPWRGFPAGPRCARFAVCCGSKHFELVMEPRRGGPGSAEGDHRTAIQIHNENQRSVDKLDQGHATGGGAAGLLYTVCVTRCVAAQVKARRVTSATQNPLVSA